MKHQSPFTKKLKNINPQMLLVIISLTMLLQGIVFAEQPPAPCHANPNAAQDRATVANRGDVRKLPQPLKDRLTQLADRPHSFLPIQAFAEADGPSQLFQYYLLDTTGFEPNVFTALFPGVNDAVQLTATGGNFRVSPLVPGLVCLVPEPPLPTHSPKPPTFF